MRGPSAALWLLVALRTGPGAGNVPEPRLRGSEIGDAGAQGRVRREVALTGRRAGLEGFLEEAALSRDWKT
ncbi:hypothetical protein P7K49_030211 [Saguinus oedipus]|uniref:Uncharacterized protein n=1 Tax=Saguinus oedipus TaxID=9490 RepID=A0ABQ9U1K1_SAGOE|nr:hypothetical protein P7K49_030211 [Saguinus oedipus]